jgi:hypothetical protein
MINGTGPGRGVPWWRWRRVLTLRWTPAASGIPGIGWSRPEPMGIRREGRLVARISR